MKTMRDWQNDHDPGVETVIFDADNPILDATVLLPDECKECGGEGYVPTKDRDDVCEAVESSGHLIVQDPCPSCEGKRKAGIVPKEQWEAASLAAEQGRRDVLYAAMDGAPEDIPRIKSATLHAIARALLGDVRVAKAVMREVRVITYDKRGGAGRWPFNPPVDIAILEKEDGA